MGFWDLRSLPFSVVLHRKRRGQDVSKFVVILLTAKQVYENVLIIMFVYYSL